MDSGSPDIHRQSDLSQCFVGCVLTFSHLNMDKGEKKELKRRVKQMGGKFESGLTKSVTHLITLDWTSLKSIHCRKHNGPLCMLPKWVDVVSSQSSKELLPANHPSFLRFRLPTFYGFTMCFSQVPLEKRIIVKQKVEKNGGKYLGDFDPKLVTHLIVIAPAGKKYEIAMKIGNVKIVNPEWFTDSIKKCKPLPEEDYPPKNMDKSPPNQNKRKSGDSFPNMSEFLSSKKTKSNLFNDRREGKSNKSMNHQHKDANISLDKADEFESILKDLGNLRQSDNRKSSASPKHSLNQSQNEKSSQVMMSLTKIKSSQSSDKISVSLPVHWEGSSA